VIRKLTLVAGFGAGYVLGAKAGTARYEQIMAKGRELAGMPAVQEATTGIQQTASTLADRARDTVNDKVGAVNDKVSGSSSSTSSGGGLGTATAPTTSGAPVVGTTATTARSTTALDDGPGAAPGAPMPGAGPSVTAPDVKPAPKRP